MDVQLMVHGEKVEFLGKEDLYRGCPRFAVSEKLDFVDFLFHYAEIKECSIDYACFDSAIRSDGSDFLSSKIRLVSIDDNGGKYSNEIMICLYKYDETKIEISEFRSDENEFIEYPLFAKILRSYIESRTIGESIPNCSPRDRKKAI